jgi:type IV secretion system protein VirD4
VASARRPGTGEADTEQPAGEQAAPPAVGGHALGLPHGGNVPDPDRPPVVRLHGITGLVAASYGLSASAGSGFGTLNNVADQLIPGYPWSAGFGLIALTYLASQLPPGFFGGRRVPRFITREARVKFRRHPGPGYAGRWSLFTKYGRREGRKRAQRTMKSLTWQDLHFGDPSRYCTYHGKAQGWIHRWGVYSHFEQVVLTIAPPQSGKSQKAAASIISAPGACVVTSIRGDLIAQTAGLRQKVGNLWIWDPEAASRYASTFRWNLVAGCQDMATANRRADHLVHAADMGGLTDSAFWMDKSAMLLTALLHAGGLIGANIRTVQQWLVERSDDPLRILIDHPRSDPSAQLIVQEFMQMQPRTRDGVVTTLSRVFRFMMVPSIVEMLTPQAGEGFDFGSFVESKDTLYLVSSARDGSAAAPLFAAFLGELAEFAQMYGTRRKIDGKWVARLDPPMTFELDEVCNITKIPLDSWVSWTSGSGIRVHVYLQTWAKAVERWGREGADALWGAATCKVLFSGISEDEVCERASKLAGKVRLLDDPEEMHDRQGNMRRQRRRTPVDVLPPDAVRSIPHGHAIVIQGDAKKITLVQVESIYDRKEYKAWEKAGSEVILVEAPRRQIPEVRPELADPHRRAQLPPRQPAEQTVDELSARRARRAPGAAPPLGLTKGPQPGPQGHPGPVRPPGGGQPAHTPPPAFGGHASQQPEAIVPESQPRIPPAPRPSPPVPPVPEAVNAEDGTEPEDDDGTADPAATDWNPAYVAPATPEPNEPPRVDPQPVERPADTPYQRQVEASPRQGRGLGEDEFDEGYSAGYRAAMEEIRAQAARAADQGQAEPAAHEELAEWDPWAQTGEGER